MGKDRTLTTVGCRHEDAAAFKAWLKANGDPKIVNALGDAMRLYMSGGYKPKWSTAPEWAEYLAQDENGDWHWYQDAPLAGLSVWETSGRFRDDGFKPGVRNWQQTLERREKC